MAWSMDDVQYQLPPWWETHSSKQPTESPQYMELSRFIVSFDQSAREKSQDAKGSQESLVRVVCPCLAWVLIPINTGGG